MSALEGQRFRGKRDEMILHRKQDQLKKHQLVQDYRMHLTDSIMENVSDVGVTVFMPHVLDDKLIENLTESAEKHKITMKTHVTTKVTREDLEMINFDGQNMSQLLFNHIRDRDILIIAWKMASGDLRPIDGMNLVSNLRANPFLPVLFLFSIQFYLNFQRCLLILQSH